jgi:uncharacterized protein YecA (UPF0149 family)
MLLGLFPEAMAEYAHFGRSVLGEQPSAQTVKHVTKVGRNDLCPCGSGKKFKKCCGIK